MQKELLLFFLFSTAAFALFLLLKLIRTRSYVHGLEKKVKELRMILDAVPDPIVAVNNEESVTYLNTAATVLTGLNRTESPTSTSVYAALALDDQTLFTPGVLNSDLNCDEFNTTINNELHVYERRLIRMNDDSSFRAGTLIFLRDISRLSNKLHKLNDTSHHYNMAFKNSPAAMALIRLADGKILDCNQSFEIISGYDIEVLRSSALISRNLFINDSRLKEIIQVVRDNMKLYNTELEINNSRGKKEIVLGSFEAITHENESCMFATFLEITEWKKTEKALIESENFAYSALDSMTSSIAVLDNAATVLYTNTAWNSRKTLLDAEEFNKESGYDLLYLIDKHYSGSEWTDTFRKGIIEVSTGVKKNDWFEFSCSNSGEEHHYICRITGFEHFNSNKIMICIDNITRLVKTEKDLLLSEQKYRSIVENSTEGIFQCDSDGQLLMTNPAFDELFRFHSENEIEGGKNIYKLLGIEAGSQTCADQLLNEISPGNIYYLIDKNGRQKHLLVKARCFNTGSAPFIEGTVMDITEQRISEIALRNSEATLRTLFDNTIQSFILLDDELRIIKWNKMAEDEITRITGISLKNRSTVHELLPQKFYSKFRELIAELKDEMHLSRQFRIREINGSVSWYELYINRYSSEYGTIGFMLTATNITQSKLAEDKINNQVSMLQKSNMELDRFVYSVSHDLRAPLTSIEGLLHIALNESSSIQMSAHLEMIRSCVRRLDDYILNILNFSRNNRQKLSIEQINFRKIIAEVRSNLRHFNGESSIRTEYYIDEDYPFYSDESRITVILNNILSNAVKYCNLEREDPYIKVHIQTAKSACIITVEDNGTGIPEEYHHKVFEMFFRTAGNISGSGLGLYIVKECCNKLHGTVELRSKPGEGSCFTITLPDLSEFNSKQTITYGNEVQERIAH